LKRLNNSDFLMKSMAVIFLFLLLISGGCKTYSERGDEADSVEKGQASIYFPELNHDFGKIKEGEKVACLFKFENRGEANLLINSVTTSCGCTIPRFSEEPVPPEGSGTIEVIFDSTSREGRQTKTVQVRSNADTPVTILRITAEIITN